MKISSRLLGITSFLAVGSLFVLVACGDETSGNTGSTSSSSSSGGESSSSSSSSSSGGGGGSSSSGSSSSGAPTLDCNWYCDAMENTCATTNLQYSSKQTCMDVCKNFDTGALADMMGNTLGCRIYHNTVASMNAANATAHCPHAGPFGEGQCGAACEDFCALNLKICTGANAAYPDMTSCTAACATFATAPPYSPTVTSGNSFACRAYHLTAAASAPAMHCAHTGAISSTCM